MTLQTATTVNVCAKESVKNVQAIKDGMKTYAHVLVQTHQTVEVDIVLTYRLVGWYLFIAYICI